MKIVFIYLIICILVFLTAFWLLGIAVKRLFGSGAENNFDEDVQDDTNEIYREIPRENVLYRKSQNSIWMSILQKAPRTIMTALLIQLLIMGFTDYVSVKYLRQIAYAGSALSQGDFGTALAALGPLAKDTIVEQTAIMRGKHRYLDEKGLHDFAYIGQKDGYNYAIMEKPYSKEHHDRSLVKGDSAWGEIMAGLSIEEAKKACRKRFDVPTKLMSIEEWNMSRRHIFSASNVSEYPNVAEWTRNVSTKDNDYYLVLQKELNIGKWAKDNDINTKIEEDKLYIDEDEFNIGGFRCSIRWKDDTAQNDGND